MDYAALGNRIKIFRKRKGYTQAELAEILGYSVQHISHVENGVTKMSIDFIIDLANVLGVSLDELFSDSLHCIKKKSKEDRAIALIKNAKEDEKELLIQFLTLLQVDIELCLNELKQQ